MRITGRFIIDSRRGTLKLQFDTDKKVHTDKVGAFVREARVQVQHQDILTSKQFRYMMALFSDFAKTFGEDVAYYKYYLKSLYCIMEEVNHFSCKNTTKENAANFIDFIISKGLDHGVNFSVAPYRQGINIEKYVYMCFEKKVCAKCNRSHYHGYPIDLHHCDTVASNGGRIYNDDELRKLPLCRECHTQAHNMGMKEFTKNFKLYGILYPSEKWYGKRIWKRLTKTQIFEKMQEMQEDDMAVSKYVLDKFYF